MKVNCASARLMFSFQRIRLRQPVWSYKPITIIRMIAWAGISVHKPDLFFFTMFCEYCFLSIIYASVNFIRCFPLIMKQKIKQNKLKKTLNLWIDLVNWKVYFSRELDFWLHYRSMFKYIYKQKLKRVPTYFICFNNFNGTEPTVIYLVNIPFSMQKGRFLSLNPLLNAGGVISV